MSIGSLVAKMDTESAFHIVPDRPLLGIKWEGLLYIDLTLPFDLRSAPKVFNSIADALAWIFTARGSGLTYHYLEFIVVWAPTSGECARDSPQHLGIYVA